MSITSTLYFNGNILTVDDKNSTVEAVGVVGERIVATGSYNDVLAQLPDDCDKENLNGHTLIPAFIDPHGHFPDSGFVTNFRADLSAPPRGNCNTLEDALTRLSDKAAQTPAGEWVMGAAFDETAIQEGRMPTREELDRVSTEHPIWVIHSSGHCGVANSVALACQGIDENAADPLGGRYFRDASGRLTGYMEGLSAMGDMADTHFLINKEKFAAGFKTTREEYLSHGVTLAQNSWTAQPLLKLFREFAEQKDPGIDLVLLPVSEDEPEISRSGIASTWPASEHITLGPRKLLTDGSFLMRTAYLSEPYYTGKDGSVPDSGLPYMEREELFDEVKKLHDMGFQIHTHCNGDAASDMYLDAIDAALQANPKQDHRHTIIHGQVMRQDQLKRCAEAGRYCELLSCSCVFLG